MKSVLLGLIFCAAAIANVSAADDQSTATTLQPGQSATGKTSTGLEKGAAEKPSTATTTGLGGQKNKQPTTNRLEQRDKGK